MVAPSVLLALLAGCNDEPASDNPVPETVDDVVVLDHEDLLIRASLDLRGVRPTLDEFETLEQTGDVDALIESFLDDPRFGSRVADLFGEVYLTRTEDYGGINFAGFDLDGVPFSQVLESIGDEPLQVLAEVAREDLPITELVTADWTMVNPILARMYPTDYPAGGTGWQRAHYTDGRPPAGVLATNGMWWRYQSTDSNANRKRANAASRILLCHDYLTRPIDFDRNVNLLDQQAVERCVQHQSGVRELPRVARPYRVLLLWVLVVPASRPSEVSAYHPSRERYCGRPTSPCGAGLVRRCPGSSLADLGQSIAGDNRFPECMVEHVTELLLRRDAELLDFKRMTAHRKR